MSKKILSMLLVLTMLVGIVATMPLTVNAAEGDVWDGTAANGFAGGSGTKADPYRITSAAEWEYFAQSVFNGTSYSGKYIELMNDITFNEGDASKWADKAPDNSVTPAGQDGDSKNPFSGSFNGNGNTVSGVYMYVDSHWGGGLFGCTDGASITNLVVVNSSFVFEAKGWAGAVVGENYNELTVSNVYVADDVYVKSIGCGAIGGIVGGLESGSEVTVTDCVFAGTVAAEEGSSGGEAGGIIGSGTQKQISVSNCLFIGYVRAKTGDSGIVGGTGGKTSTVNNCISAGDVYYDLAAKCADTSHEYINDCYYIGTRPMNSGKGKMTNVNKLSGISDIYGVSASICPEGFVRREKDVIVPEGVSTFDLPQTKHYDTISEFELDEVDGKYFINNVDQYLYFMENVSDYNGETVVIGDDIDFTGTEGILRPISDFTGTLDGNGKTFSNISMSGNGDVGLFCGLGSGATITDLIIRDSTFEIDGNGNWLGTIACCTNGDGVVISNIYIAPDVNVICNTTHSNSYAGGILGGVYGPGANVTVDNCIFAGTVTGTGRYVAAIVGNSESGNTTKVSNCLNAGYVSGESNFVSGIAVSYGGITVENCVNAGVVSASDSSEFVAGILAGDDKDAVVAKNNYTIGTAVSVDGEATSENNQENLRRAELLGSSSVVALEGWTKVEGDFTMPNGAKDYVTETLYNAEMPEPEPEPETLRGEGTAEAPFLIADADEWVLFMELAADNNFDGQYVKLEADIDFDDVKLSPIEGFKGTLDGNGKVLKNINMTKAKNSGDLALFCALGDNATIKNFSIVSSTFEIKGNANWVGTVACCTNGKNVTISNIYVGKDVKVIAGKADGNSIAGGILGGVYGKIQASVLVENCVFAGTVIGTGDSVAGIVGSVEQKVAEGVEFNTVTVRNCLNAGLVVGDNHIAGIVGGQGMTVENCVNAGTVRSKGKIVAAIATSNPNTTVVVDGCYYANGSLMAFGDRGDSLVEYGTNVYADINKLTGTNAQAPATFTKRAGDLAIPTGCTNVSETLVTLSLLDGAAVRLSDPSGIRFTAVLGGAYLNSFMGEGKTVSFGVIVTPTDYVESADAFNVEALKALGHNVNYKEIAADKLQNDAEADESYVFTGVLAPIQEGNYNRAFSAIAYIKVVDAEGNVSYYYSDYDASVNSRSIAQVAEAAYKDTNYKQTDYYQYKLDDSHTDGEAVWSPYTADDRKALLSFYRDGGAIDVSFLSYNIRNVEDTSGWLDRPTYEYTDREKYLRDYLLNYDADVIGLQEAAKLKATLGTLDWFDVIGDDDTKAGLTAAGYTCVKGEDIYGGNNSEKTMYNPIYYKTDKYDLVASGTKWLTSTPGVVSTIDGGDTTKALNYVVLEDKESGQQFLYVNIHLMVRRSNYVHDAEGNDTEHYVQELEVIYLRAILEQLQNQYPELPMFVGGDFNNSYTGINTWFDGSVVGENDWEITEGTPTEEIVLDVARDQATSKAPKRYSCTTGDFTQINPEAIEENWGAIDLWYTSNFDGVVHVYEIVDNYNESVGKYPSDHLPAKLYVTLYTK